MQATHFVEVFKNEMSGRVTKGVLSEIKYHDRNLKITKDSSVLKTVQVWKIKLKPGIVIATHDSELNATIIEKA